jgi:acyl carrier protein
VGSTDTGLDERIASLVLEYAQTPCAPPLAATLSLQRDLTIDSLSLVSLVLRIGDEVGVDLVEAGVELGRLATVGDLVTLARSLVRKGEAL